MFFKVILILYNLVLTAVLVFQGMQSPGTSADFGLLTLLLPVGVYFVFAFIERVGKIRLGGFKSLAFSLSLVATSLIFLLNLLNAGNSSEYSFALLVLPLPLYFWGKAIGRLIKGLRNLRLRKKPVVKEEFAAGTETMLAAPEEGPPPEDQVHDPHRRNFLKQIGGAGLGLLAYSLLNPKKVGAAFFGSVPGPGTVSLKDTADVKIDPAIKSPTDAYGISELDDGDPAYYGFINKAGNWYILQEDETIGDFSYRYAKGDTNFSGAWTNRGGQTYQYFNQTFG